MPAEQSWLDLRPGEWQGPVPRWQGPALADFMAPASHTIAAGYPVHSGLGLANAPFSGQLLSSGPWQQPGQQCPPKPWGLRVRLVTCRPVAQPGVIPHPRPLMKAGPGSAGGHWAEAPFARPKPTLWNHPQMPASVFPLNEASSSLFPAIPLLPGWIYHSMVPHCPSSFPAFLPSQAKGGGGCYCIF